MCNKSQSNASKSILWFQTHLANYVTFYIIVLSVAFA